MGGALLMGARVRARCDGLRGGRRALRAHPNQRLAENVPRGALQETGE